MGWRGFGLGIVVAACAIQLTGCYTLQQAWHFQRIMLSRESISEVLASEPPDSPLHRRLGVLRDVLAFAAEHGLTVGGAYRDLVRAPGDVVSHLVQAAPADRLEFKTWWFPVVGSVPYLGYAEREDRDAMATALRAEGWDVAVGDVAAFSGLGWFDDPVFRGMLMRADRDLAHLFFHELTHRTVWVPGNVGFNENLAEFVAEGFTAEFLRRRAASDELAAYESDRGDRARFHTWLKDLRLALEVLYARRDEQSAQGLAEAKAATIAAALGPGRLPVLVGQRYADIAKRDWNNASILAEALYGAEGARFRAAAACVRPRGGAVHSGVVALVGRLRGERWSDDPWVLLDRVCERSA